MVAYPLMAVSFAFAGGWLVRETVAIESVSVVAP